MVLNFSIFAFRGPFLQSPDNFSGPKSNIQIEIKRIRARVLASKIVHFVSLTDSFIMLDKKTIEISIFHVNNNSFRGPFIIGTFEKQAPGHLQDDNKAKELLVT